MADTSNLTQFLTDVASAIKEKNGKTDKIPAANFDTEIKAINTGGVKLFKTIEEMRADTTSETNAQAIVYGDAETILQSGVSYSKLSFPNEVVFDTVQTSSFTIRLGGFLNSIKFSPTACSIGISVKYTSEDGITYTRTDTKGNPVSMRINMRDTDMDSYGDILSKFIFPVVKSFLGLYTWSGSSWKYSSTQLSDLTEADLLPYKVVYGKNGIVVGSNAIFDNIPVKNKLGMFYGLDSIEAGSVDYYSLKDITTDIPVSAPEENVTVHFLKSKTLENGDKLILKPNGTANNQTSFDGLYSLSYNLNSNVLTITNNTTKETYETFSNNSNNISCAAFYGHIVYCIQSKITSGTAAGEWTFQINKYDIDAGIWTMGASYSTTGSSNSYSPCFILFTELDIFAICDYYYANNNIGPKKLILMGKLSDITQDFWLKYDVVPTDYSRTVYRSSDNTLLVLISNTELREYSPEGNLLHTYTINLPTSISEYVGSYPYFHPFCQRVSNILYMNKYKINLDTGVCEEIDEIHPTMGNNITSSVSKYSNNMIYLFDTDYNITATYQAHKDLATVVNGGLHIYSPNLTVVQNNSDGNVVLTDGTRKVTGIPYTVSDIFDYDNVIIPCMGYRHDNSLVENYILVEKGAMNKAQYDTAVATTEDILGNTAE